MDLVTRWRRVGAVTGASGLSLILAGVVHAAALWTLTASPVAAIVGQASTFSMLAVNVQGPAAGCLTVDLGAAFLVQGVSTPVASDGTQWTASVAGTEIELTSVSGTDKLDPGESLSFTFRLTPTTVGTWSWSNHIQINKQCNGAEYPGTPVVIVVAPPPPGPSVAPVVTPAPLPVASVRPAPTPTPRPSPSTAPSPVASQTPRPDVLPPTASAAPNVPSDVRLAGWSQDEEADLGLGAQSFALMDQPLVWFVPGAAVGVPGLLVLLFIAAQAAGAAAWIPAVRRMADPSTGNRRRRGGAGPKP